MEYTNGTKGTFSHPELPKMGTMTGVIENDREGTLFIPDLEFHDRLYKIYWIEPEAGLGIDGGIFTPAE